MGVLKKTLYLYDPWQAMEEADLDAPPRDFSRRLRELVRVGDDGDGVTDSDELGKLVRGPEMLAAAGLDDGQSEEAQTPDEAQKAVGVAKAEDVRKEILRKLDRYKTDPKRRSGEQVVRMSAENCSICPGPPGALKRPQRSP
jgi:hypothetical protein